MTNKEPLYSELDNYKGLDLVYRHPCLHYQSHEECSNCKYGLVSECAIYKEYIKISQDLQLLELLKMLVIVEENKRITLGNGRYHIRIKNDIIYDDEFAKGLKERLEND